MVLAGGLVSLVPTWTGVTLPVQAEMLGCRMRRPAVGRPHTAIPLQQTPAPVEPSLPLLVAEGLIPARSFPAAWESNKPARSPVRPIRRLEAQLVTASGASVRCIVWTIGELSLQ